MTWMFQSPASRTKLSDEELLGEAVQASASQKKAEQVAQARQGTSGKEERKSQGGR